MSVRSMYDWPEVLQGFIDAIKRQNTTLCGVIASPFRQKLSSNPFDRAMIEALNEMQIRCNHAEAFVRGITRHMEDRGYHMEDRANGDLDNPLYVVMDKAGRVVARCADQNDAEAIVMALNCTPTPYPMDTRTMFNQFFRDLVERQPSIFTQDGATANMRVPYGWNVDLLQTDQNTVFFTVTDKEYCKDVLEGRA